MHATPPLPTPQKETPRIPRKTASPAKETISVRGPRSGYQLAARRTTNIPEQRYLEAKVATLSEEV